MQLGIGDGMVLFKDSIRYWAPQLAELGVNTPKTSFVDADITSQSDKPVLNYSKEEVIEAINELGGYPVFVKFDTFSGKYAINKCSKIQDEDDIEPTLSELFDFIASVISLNMHKGFVEQIALREWVNIQNNSLSGFYHGDTPMGYEFRVFINDKKPVCKHFYWVEDEIIFDEDDILDLSGILVANGEVEFGNFIQETDLTVSALYAVLRELEENSVVEKEFKEGTAYYRLNFPAFRNFDLQKVLPYEDENACRNRLHEARKKTMARASEVQPIVKKLCDNFSGCWAADFALDTNNVWHVIEMGTCASSFSFDTCCPDQCEKNEMSVVDDGLLERGDA